MKHCPVCHTQYDEEVLRFCTRDGAPLIEDDQPHFDAMPSESMESEDRDFGEDTVVRGAPPVTPVATQTENPRIVIPTTEDPQPRQTVRSRPAAYAPPSQQKPNTGKVVALTVICTLAVIAGVAAVVMLLRGGEPTNTNVNLSANMFNLNTNLNNNLNIDANLNYNSTININSSTTIPNLNLNFNTNSNLKSPTPTRTPTPSPSPTASPSPAPSTSPTPARSPSPSASATPRFPHDPGPPMTRVSPTPRRTP